MTGEQQQSSLFPAPAAPAAAEPPQGRKALIVTRHELARLFGVTPDGISRWTADGLPVETIGAGRGNKSTYDLARVIPWVLQRRGGTLEEARTRLANAQADRVEQELATAAGRLLRADAVGETWRRACILIRTKLLAIPAKLKNRHTELSVQQLADVDEQIREALSELAEAAAAPGDVEEGRKTV